MANQHSKCDDCYKTHLPEAHDKQTQSSESEWKQKRREIVIELTNHYIEYYKYDVVGGMDKLSAFARDIAENEIDELLKAYASTQREELLDGLRKSIHGPTELTGTPIERVKKFLTRERTALTDPKNTSMKGE